MSTVSKDSLDIGETPLFCVHMYKLFWCTYLINFSLFVTSTFGNGEPPKMAESMASWLDSKMTKSDVLKSKNLDLPGIPEEEAFEENHLTLDQDKEA